MDPKHKQILMARHELCLDGDDDCWLVYRRADNSYLGARDTLDEAYQLAEDDDHSLRRI